MAQTKWVTYMGLGLFYAKVTVRTYLKARDENCEARCLTRGGLALPDGLSAGNRVPYLKLTYLDSHSWGQKEVVADELVTLPRMKEKTVSLPYGLSLVLGVCGCHLPPSIQLEGICGLIELPFFL